MVKFSRTERPLTLSHIEKVEGEVGLNFPEQYKKHLLLYNGGRCEPSVFTFVENGKVTSSCVDWFLAIYKGKVDSLREYIEWYKTDEKRLPIHILPIAHDPGGNLVCISCGDLDYGYVYFWDHENEVDYTTSDDTDYSNLYLIAKSFDQFLAGLKTSDTR